MYPTNWFFFMHYSNSNLVILGEYAKYTVTKMSPNIIFFHALFVSFSDKQIKDFMFSLYLQLPKNLNQISLVMFGNYFSAQNENVYKINVHQILK